MKTRTSLVALALLFLAAPASAANRPTGYKTICAENKTCSVASLTRVAFGRAGQFFYKELSGSFACSASTFGGRIAGGVNECSVPLKPMPVITGASCVSTGVVPISATIDVPAGTTFDGGCKTYAPTQAWANSLPGEGIPIVFTVREGATLRNVIIDGSVFNDGVYTYGNVLVDNVTWTSPPENALTIKATGNVDVRNASILAPARDSAFRLNAISTLKVINLSSQGSQGGSSFFRQNGGTTFKTDISCDSCDTGPSTAVFRTDSAVSTAILTNSRKPATTPLCRGYASGNCTSSNVLTY